MSTFKHPRTGRWVAQVYDPRAKKKVQLGTRGTKREAEALIVAHHAKELTSATTVAEWRARWLDDPDWKPGTRVHNEQRTRHFTVKYGEKLMADIDRVTARAWVRAHSSHHGALSAMFGAAVYDDVVTSNPFSKLVKRKVARRDLQPDWLTDDDITMLEAAALRAHGPEYGPTMAAMIRFAAETGIRPGELYVIREQDLDPKNGRMYVRWAADSHSRTVGTPKNGEPREIVLSKRAAQAAARAIRWEVNEPVHESGYDPTGRIFSTPRGHQVWNPNMTWLWKPVKACFGRPEMEFYESRHYCATRLLQLGLSAEDVAVQLGHTDGGKLVISTYGHPNNVSARARLREAMEREAA